MEKQEFGDRLTTVMTEPAPTALAPDQLLAKALERDINPDALGRMMDLYERHERLQAERQYVAAMAAFKADPPKIRKTKHVKYASKGGNTDYHHAPLDEVTRSISVAMSPHGLSFRWRTQQLDGLISVTCVLQHVGGHSEEVTLQASPDQSGGKNSIQAVGSTVTYLQRYTLLAATGLAAEDQDDDGQAADEPLPGRVTAHQIEEIRAGMEYTKISEEKLLGKFLPGVPNARIEHLPAEEFHNCIAWLRSEYKRQQTPKPEAKPESEVEF